MHHLFDLYLIAIEKDNNSNGKYIQMEVDTKEDNSVTYKKLESAVASSDLPEGMVRWREVVDSMLLQGLPSSDFYAESHQLVGKKSPSHAYVPLMQVLLCCCHTTLSTVISVLLFLLCAISPPQRKFADSYSMRAENLHGVKKVRIIVNNVCFVICCQLLFHALIISNDCKVIS